MLPNAAAWIVEAKAKPLEVKSAPYTPPGDNEIVVMNRAVAINPVDAVSQARAIFPLNYPAILGSDVAGEVIEVGLSVTSFSKGDRVLGFALGSVSKRSCEGAFQHYTVLLAHMASKIPASLSFDHAAVMPLGLSTAAAGLYQKGYLELQHPSVEPKLTGKTLLVWGGSSSVGCNAIQLAVASGYEVIATTSPKNFDLAKKLGACQVFNYKSKTILEDLIDALKEKSIAGAIDAVGIGGAFHSCIAVVEKSNGNKFVSFVRPDAMQVTLPEGVTAKFIQSAEIKDNEISKVIFEDFLPTALAEGKFVAAPEPEVVGDGLENVQAGLDTWMEGVSAKKLVVSLS